MESRKNSKSLLRYLNPTKKVLLSGISFCSGFAEGFNPGCKSEGMIIPLISALLDDIKIIETETDNSRLKFNPEYRSTNLAFKTIVYYSLYIAGQQAGQLTRNLR